jgi:hypothetical protein
MIYIRSAEFESPEDPFENPYWRAIGLDWIWAKLDKQDEEFINYHGKARQNRRLNSKYDRAKVINQGEKYHIHGFASEYMVSQMFGTKVDISSNPSKSDILDNIEVKSAIGGESHKWSILIKDQAFKISSNYILVFSYFYPKYLACIGWQSGSFISMQPKKIIEMERYKEQMYRCFWNLLRPVDELLVLKGIQ